MKEIIVLILAMFLLAMTACRYNNPPVIDPSQDNPSASETHPACPLALYPYDEAYMGTGNQFLPFLYRQGAQPLGHHKIELDLSKLRDGCCYFYHLETKTISEITGPIITFEITSEHLYYVPKSQPTAICRRSHRTGSIGQLVNLKALLGEDRTINRIEYFGSSAISGMFLILLDNREIVMYELSTKTLTSLMTQESIEDFLYLPHRGSGKDDPCRLVWKGKTDPDGPFCQYAYDPESGDNVILNHEPNLR